MNKAMKTGIIIVAIIIILSLSAYFVIKELSSTTGNVISDKDIIGKITIPGKAVDTNPILPHDNSTKSPPSS